MAEVILRTEDDFRRASPSMQMPRPEKPFGWIQWKGTAVCMDVHCLCGEFTHIDAEFCYHIKCKCCGRVYEVDGHVRLNLLDFEPESTKETS